MKKAIITTALVLLIMKKAFSKSNSAKFANITANNDIRECDPKGCGHFGANRGYNADGTRRYHRGIDLVANENDAIKTPFDCVVNRYGYVAGDKAHQLIELQGVGGFKDYKAKIMYVKYNNNVNVSFSKGEIVCYADDIKQKYGTSITPHVHVEIYKKGVLIDPTPFVS
ncbi:M23 family metallopeptidase [Aurantibacter aestuarii]|uniref:M23ase beta-sheet core domain-containing protein n=1 Tax=Aurantibacter aestuarii TaxID=1266046 RepID=A0A2T1NEJ5_9FLAO|nr:peptidoglycan DD-metalloendopeptidase family protein [Aurantibacter aestuarii]PSG90871.1 hypothetical protein C7H52_06250 [Aurantibacter aestuarii]